MKSRRPVVVGLGSLIAAGAIGGIIAIGLSGSPAAVKAPAKVQIVQRSDSTTPTTTVPTVTPTTVAATAPDSSSTPSGPAPVASAPPVAPAAVQPATAPVVTPAPTTTTAPVTYCGGSLAADQAATTWPQTPQDQGDLPGDSASLCTDPIGAFYVVAPGSYDNTAEGVPAGVYQFS